MVTSNIKTAVALGCEISPSEMGRLPNGRQYFVSFFSVSNSFLSKLASTTSFKTNPASKPKKAIKIACKISVKEKLPFNMKPKNSPAQKSIGHTKKKCKRNRSANAFILLLTFLSHHFSLMNILN